MYKKSEARIVSLHKCSLHCSSGKVQKLSNGFCMKLTGLVTGKYALIR
jgi:hypothetical protein